MPTTFTDQMNRQVDIDTPPRRIVSLVPSQTELLSDLGLEKEVVGITKFCVHPERWFRTKARVGGTKKLKLDQIRALQPDLIIGNHEENMKEDIEALEQEFPVWMSDVVTMEDAFGMIASVGKITGRAGEAINMVQGIREEFNKLLQIEPLKAAYFIWQKPLMAVGHSTFIHTMLETWGLQNVFAHRPRYPGTCTNRLRQMAAELTETTRLYARCVARIEPEWLLGINQDVLRRSYSEPHWHARSGRVMAYERTLPLMTLVAVFVLLVSLWTPFLDNTIHERWFSWPNIAYLSPVPLVTALTLFALWRAVNRRREIQPFLLSIALFLLCYLGLGISLFPLVVPHSVTIWAAASATPSLLFMLVGVAILLPIILAYTAYTYWVFRGKVREGEGYH
jgi:ABC-type Fe3+-citrate transport system substrate-binding protein